MSPKAPRGLRDALRRLLGRPPSDWAGPDPARPSVRLATPPSPENLHAVVRLGRDPETSDSRLSALAAAGHPVFLVLHDPAIEPALYASRPLGPGLREVRVREIERAFESLDLLRREHLLGATVSVVEDRSWRPAAERLRAERGWPVVDLADGEPAAPGEAAFAETLKAAFPQISIVIVTFNNLDLNRACLESIFARTDWPCCEILVVDNGSSDGTPELLAELARAHENLRVIALPENRGYPAACNVGMAEATGDPLILLNNDTVVTHGWLTALNRHLAANPKLALVGPVTNAIANEAKVEVGYSDLGELPRWARRWAYEHDGETFAISMLAFFCVALRREAYEAVGPLDERFGLGLFEDGDYNRRLRARGWDIRCARDAFVHHWQNASFRRLGKDAYFALYEENKKKLEEKWRETPEGTGSPAG